MTKDVRAAFLACALDRLPMFASDAELAEAIVGKKNARQWLLYLPALEAKAGFPKVDEIHGGRPVPLVRLFYINYLRMPGDMKGAPDGVDDEAAWNRKARERAAKRAPAPKR